MTIVRQVDATYAGDDFVAFVESEPNYLKCNNSWEEMNGGDTYFISLHHKPLNASDGGMGFMRCKHRHREIDAAVRCAKRMLRLARLKGLP